MLLFLHLCVLTFAIVERLILISIYFLFFHFGFFIFIIMFNTLIWIQKTAESLLDLEADDFDDWGDDENQDIVNMVCYST